ncbi:MAG: UpxY family transcription antiterminator [Ignavibacteriaceae bacterium]|nr:UpxY family transcription antiterminator [Ignavibacteriaceae bacterium]
MSDENKKIEDPFQKYWFALYTRSRSEFKAAEQLLALDVQFYLPTVIKWKKWSDRRKKIQEPILKGYIFIFANEKERKLSLEQAAIVRCVFDHGRPAKIPEWQLDNLKKMLSNESEFLIQDGLVPGVKVKIKEGPFKGIIGVVHESDNGKTIAVSIDLLRRSVIAHLPKESIFEVVKEI